MPNFCIYNRRLAKSNSLEMDKFRYLSAHEYGTHYNAIAPTNNVFFSQNEANSCHLTKHYNERSTGVRFYSTYRPYGRPNK